jgi:hypothetical protein
MSQMGQTGRRLDLKAGFGSTTVLCDGGRGLKRKAQSPISPSPYLHQLNCPIAGLGEASKCLPTIVADYRTSRFASTASEAAAK